MVSCLLWKLLLFIFDWCIVKEYVKQKLCVNLVDDDTDNDDCGNMERILSPDVCFDDR